MSDKPEKDTGYEYPTDIRYAILSSINHGVNQESRPANTHTAQPSVGGRLGDEDFSTQL